ncbi:MAG TPA: sigma-70 family RNA polymerase sigma factor [Gemmataceae bacterium]|nr:sigma-70 family RNA polymerase sigma factor [Gemmataceae bacterium]
MSEDSTQILQAFIDRMNEGDSSALAALLEHANARLVRVARVIRKDFPRLQNHEETGDVLQKSMIRLLRALQTVKVTTAKEFLQLSALQIRRELLDLARRPTWVKNATDIDGAVPDDSDHTHNPFRLADWTEFHRKVESLPEEEREVVHLLWYQGMQQAEAASVLKVSVPTVKRRWMSARLRLKSVLQEDT